MLRHNLLTLSQRGGSSISGQHDCFGPLVQEHVVVDVQWYVHLGGFLASVKVQNVGGLQVVSNVHFGDLEQSFDFCDVPLTDGQDLGLLAKE